MNRGIFTVIDTQATAAATAAAAAQDAANKAMQRANQATAAAAAAQATGTNAAASAADLAAAVASGNSTHADLYSRLANIQLTPGPDGKAGVNGVDGKAGADGKAGLDGKNSTVTIATGSSSTPLLAINATADITITLTHAMSTATYNIEPLPSAALLGNYTWTIKSRTTTTVVLTIKATVALAASTLGLVAWLSA